MCHEKNVHTSFRNVHDERQWENQSQGRRWNENEQQFDGYEISGLWGSLILFVKCFHFSSSKMKNFDVFNQNLT